MTVSQSTTTTDTFAAQFGQERVKTAVSIDVPAELANTTATVQFQLSDEDLGDTAVDDLQVVKNTAGGSQVLSSSTATENGSVVITARTPGFSEFAVIEAPSETSSTTDEEESTAETTTDDGGSDASGDEESDEPADESTDTNTPGFGPLVALIALLAAALIARRRQ
jgi:PGF-CTERM protein